MIVSRRIVNFSRCDPLNTHLQEVTMDWNISCMLWESLNACCGNVWTHVVGKFGRMLWESLDACCGNVWTHVVGKFGRMLWESLDVYCGEVWMYVVGKFGCML